MKFSGYRPEDHRLEFKKQLTDRLEREVVAFLNSRSGGTIIIGVDNHGEVVGVDDTDSLQLKIKDRIKNNIMPSTMGLFEVSILTEQGCSLIKVIIASGREKPYYLKQLGMTEKGCTIRMGSACEPMPSYMIEQLFATRVRNSIGNVRSRVQDLSFEQLRIYYHETKYSLNEQFANNLELLTEDTKYNYAAYLLADKNGCSIKVGKYAGLDRYNLVENDEFGFCCLVKAAKSILNKLNIENKTYTQITKNQRLQQNMLDPVALREAVINAIVHNDFSHEVSPKFE